MKFSQYNPPYSDGNKWKEICPPNSYRKIDPGLASGLLPERLLNKADSIVVMASGTGATDVIVANILRVDVKAKAIDQQPYIYVADNVKKVATGGFVDHGNWPGRTKPCGDWFIDQVERSGIPRYLPLPVKDLPATSGPLTDLQSSSHTEAFWESIGLKKKAEQGKRYY